MYASAPSDINDLYYDYENDLIKFGLIMHGWWKLVGIIINEVMTWYEISLSPGWKNWYWDVDGFDNGCDFTYKLWWADFANMMVQLIGVRLIMIA